MKISKEELITFAIAMMIPFSFSGYIITLFIARLDIAAVFFVLFASSFIFLIHKSGITLRDK